jgi:endoglucanase
MNQKDIDFIRQLLDTPSPTGQEMGGQRIWAAKVRETTDQVSCDAYGNTWAMLIGAGSKVVLLEAHADEIGYMVKYVDPRGFIRLDKVGGSDVSTARGRKVVVLGDKGDVSGVVGNTAIHLREGGGGSESAPKLKDLWVDVGARSREEVRDLGIHIGNLIVYSTVPRELYNDRLVGRALDNRLGGFIIAKVLERVAAEAGGPSHTLICLNSVQEEVGGNGATVGGHQFPRPDIIISIDATHATDTPGLNPAEHGEIDLGGGPVLTHGAAIHDQLLGQIKAVAKERGIPLQLASSGLSTGTDADKLFLSSGGIPTALVSYPLRYMHSAVETVDLSDVESTVDLLASFVLSLREEDHFGWRL